MRLSIRTKTGRRNVLCLVVGHLLGPWDTTARDVNPILGTPTVVFSYRSCRRHGCGYYEMPDAAAG